MNQTITPELGRELRAKESVLPAAADALADLEKAQAATAAAHAKVAESLALEQQWQRTLSEITKLKAEVQAIEKTIPAFKEKTELLKHRISQRVADSSIGSYENLLDELIRRERVAKMLPETLTKRRAELAEALTEAVEFAGEHKIPRAQLPEGVPTENAA